MTIEEEMVGTMYSKCAFTDKEGNLVGLNLYNCGLEDKQIAFFSRQEIKAHLSKLKSLNLSGNNISKFLLSADFPNLVYVTLNENENLAKIKCDKGLSNLARLEMFETGITDLEIPTGYNRLFYLDLSSNKKLSEFQI